MTHSISTQKNVFKNTPNELMYPFKSKFIELNAGKMHYVDEGSGDVILFVHGTPVWSFVWRNQIKELSKNFRCIAIDHIGFGLSEKPTGFDGTPQSHSANLSEFVRKMKLEGIRLVVHDFGGPVGLSFAVSEPEKIRSVTMFNTWLWETESNPEIQKIYKILNSALGKFMYLNLNFSPKILLKKGFYDKKKLKKAVHKQYINVFPTKKSRISLLNLGKSLKESSAWYQAQWEKIGVLEQKPWLILWGTEDQFITKDFLKRWTDRLPEAEVKTFKCGHFVQEEQAGQSAKEINDFLLSF